MIDQTWIFRKAISPLFADRVTFIEGNFSTSTVLVPFDVSTRLCPLHLEFPSIWWQSIKVYPVTFSINTFLAATTRALGEANKEVVICGNNEWHSLIMKVFNIAP